MFDIGDVILTGEQVGVIVQIASDAQVVFWNQYGEKESCKDTDCQPVATYKEVLNIFEDKIVRFNNASG